MEVHSPTPYLAETPHERPINSHQLLVINHVCFVEHDPDLVLVPLHRLNAAAELVRDVEFVRVEEEKNSVNPLGKPLHNPREVIPTVPSLFLTTKKKIRKGLIQNLDMGDLRMPGVSTSEMPDNTGEGQVDSCSLLGNYYLYFTPPQVPLCGTMGRLNSRVNEKF